MSKQYRSQGNGGNDNLGPINNDDLADELKAAILQQCYPMILSKTKEGCLKFSIRGGHLAINHILEEKEMNAKSVEVRDKVAETEKSEVTGMSRSGVKTLILIFGETLKEMQPVSHGTVYMYYTVDENGEYVTGRIVIDKGFHHPRF